MQLKIVDISPEVQQAKARLGIVGNAPALVAAVARALRVAPFDLSVLVTGESGSGKEFFPKLIHQNSRRKHGAYVAVNCGAIPEGTIDSELFGHEKGAFTGAIASRKGYFEEVDGGTIFLDEVAELPLTTQARLLRVLETGEFIRVGSSVVQRSDVRIVAATNMDMARAVAEGRFREDLYYRLSTVQIAVPPLRERGHDAVLLAAKFASEFAERYRTAPLQWGDGAREALMRYRWPGNVRQLKNIVEQLALFEGGNEVTAETLMDYLPQMPMAVATATDTHSDNAAARERSMMLSMIMNLRREIDMLKERLDAAEQHRHPMALTEPSALTERAIVKFEPFLTEVPERVVDEDAADTVTLEENERELIRRTLERCSGHRKAAAQELNISERTLYRKIKSYGLEQ